MNLDERLSNVAVVGAAGKMGSGISLLLAQQLGMAKAKNPDKDIVLHLIDTRDQGLYDLVQYIRGQIVKMAEKQIVKLRQLYQNRGDLVENSEIIDELVNTTLGILRPTKELASAKDSSMVFEAVIESESLKIDIFKQLKSICKDDTYFFTNTSSIPIRVVDEGANLQGHIIGYHFYNPPAIQKLLEIITWEKTTQELQDAAEEIAKRLRKTVVFSNDVAGFIGNGHFIREGLYALQKTQELQEQHSFTCAVYLMNKVTQDFLMRPMGIFQLLDYVGIDVYNFILQIMDKYIEGETFQNELIDTMIKNKALGGQRGDGSQKDGFFQYEKGKMVGVYCYKQDKYVPLDSTAKWDELLGDYPASWKPWKKMLKQKPQAVAQIFSELNSSESLGCQLASKYAQASKEIAENLVKNGVALCNSDVDTVLLTGFFHAYGITTIQRRETMKKLRKPVYFACGYNTISLGTGRSEFHPKKPRPGLEEYIKEAGQGVIAQISDAKHIDEGIISNFIAARFNRQAHLAAMIPMIDKALVHKPCSRVEGACASGGLALSNAVRSVLAETADVVLVIGVEVQNTVKAIYGADYLAAAGHYKAERKNGHAYFFPGKFSDRAGAYYEKFGEEAARKAMAHWYVQAIENARTCENAQEFENKASDLLSLGMKSPNPKGFVDHLNLFDCSKVSDGASAIICASEEGLQKLGIAKDKAVQVIGVGQSEDDLTQAPEDLTRLTTTQDAVQKAYNMAEISVEKVGVVELHDCFSITGILALEAAGFAAHGKGGDIVVNGDTKRGGKVPVNTTGGLVGYGHPTGATGIRQMIDVCNQVTGQAGNSQIDMTNERPYGLTINMGGNDRTVVSMVVKKVE